MYKKIIFLFEVFPVVTYSKRYDYKTLFSYGFQIDVCDLSMIGSDLYKRVAERFSSIEGINNFRFKTKKEFKDYLSCQNENVFIWSTFQLTAEHYWVFKCISKFSYGYICNVDYVVPRCKTKSNKTDFWTNFTWNRFSNALLFRIPRKLLPIRKADAIITYGEDDIQRKLKNVLYDNHTIIELSNTIDYNECYQLLFGDSIAQEKNRIKDYVVFIDEYMPYHPDGISLGIKIDAKTYYSEIEKYLDNVSKILEMPVIIAAHPKSDYKSHPECYKGKEIVQFKTAELIKGSKLVISHLSIAIGMALICRKPFVLITTSDVTKNVYSNGEIDDYEADYEHKVINISLDMSDSEIETQLNEAMRIENNYYDRQLRKFKLSDNNPNCNKSLGQIMNDVMKRVKENEK